MTRRKKRKGKKRAWGPSNPLWRYIHGKTKRAKRRARLRAKNLFDPKGYSFRRRGPYKRHRARRKVHKKYRQKAGFFDITTS